MKSVLDVADYFLNLANNEDDETDLISNLKLQKLVYYAQGFSLALSNTPLFSEEIEAWNHGPVTPVLYQNKKKHGPDAIPPNPDFDASIFTDDQQEILNEVYEVYGQFSAWKLRNMTHEESPWSKNKETNEVISHDDLKEYFNTQIN